MDSYELLDQPGGAVGEAGAGSGPSGSLESLLAQIESPKLRRLLESAPDHPSIDWEQMVRRRAGWRSGGDLKRRLTMLTSVIPRLDTLLYPGERVEFITKGVLNSFLEQYFMGLWSYTINRTLFLFTNYRVILIACDRKGRARTMMWQIPYHRIQKYGAGGLTGSIGFKLVGGRTQKFFGVPRFDRQCLKRHVTQRIGGARESGFEFPSHQGRDRLCATCATPLVPRSLVCGECGERFIAPWKPALMSLVLPGLGDLYLGHRTMAIVEFIGFAFIVMIVVEMINGPQPTGIVPALIFLAVVNSIDALITLHVARKGAIPVRRAWRG